MRAVYLMAAGGVTFAVLGAGGTVLVFGAGTETADLARGAALYAEHCAACHGANLEGAENWREAGPDGRLPAPPHDATGHTWHHADRVLFEITKYGSAAVIGGGYESDMIGFGDVMSDAAIRDVLAFIKSTWPERERAFQAEITRRTEVGG
jgi:mono/diheme cytochrome c family protein